MDHFWSILLCANNEKHCEDKYLITLFLLKLEHCYPCMPLFFNTFTLSENHDPGQNHIKAAQNLSDKVKGAKMLSLSFCCRNISEESRIKIWNCIYYRSALASKLPSILRPSHKKTRLGRVSGKKVSDGLFERGKAAVCVPADKEDKWKGANPAASFEFVVSAQTPKDQDSCPQTVQSLWKQWKCVCGHCEASQADMIV